MDCSRNHTKNLVYVSLIETMARSANRSVTARQGNNLSDAAEAGNEKAVAPLLTLKERGIELASVSATCIYPHPALGLRMPAKSKKQQMAAGAALSAKRGKRPKSSLKGASRQMAKSMSTGELRKLAHTKRRRLPTRKSTKTPSRSRARHTGR